MPISSHHGFGLRGWEVQRDAYRLFDDSVVCLALQPLAAGGERGAPLENTRALAPTKAKTRRGSVASSD